MNWLTQSFIESAKNSWLAKYIPAEKIPAVVHLLDQRDHVLELLPDAGHGDLKSYFDAAVAYRNNSPEYRQSFATASSVRSSVFSAVPESRDSLLSDITTFSNISTNSTRRAYDSTIEHGGLRDSLPIRVDGSSHSSSTAVGTRARGILLKEKKYRCPSCPNKGAKRPADFLKHLKNFCEKPQKGFKCLGCNVVEKEEADIQSHGLMHNHIYAADFELPPKKAYGCPFCGSYHKSLEAYSACMCTDQDDDSIRHARPSLRIRGLLQQEGINPTLIGQCKRRGLDPDAWTTMIWDDTKCARFSQKLEHGCNVDDATCACGVEDAELFVDELLDCAKFEKTGKPVPPVKDVVEAEPRSVLQERPSEVVLNSFTSDNEVPQNFDPAEPAWTEYFDFRPSETSSDDIQERTAMALQNTQPEYPLWGNLRTKRPPSTSASSLEAARSRSKRPPISNNFTTWNAEESDFPLHLMDPALSVFRNALHERTPIAQITNNYVRSAPQAQMASATLNTAQTTQSPNLDGYEYYDGYEGRR